MEAHAADEWPIKELDEEIFQHKTVEDRLVAARNFTNLYEMHPCFEIAVDNDENVFVEQYPSWPFRYWGFESGKIRVKSMAEGDLVTLDSLVEWLDGFRY